MPHHLPIPPCGDKTMGVTIAGLVYFSFLYLGMNYCKPTEVAILAFFSVNCCISKVQNIYTLTICDFFRFDVDFNVEQCDIFSVSNLINYNFYCRSVQRKTVRMQRRHEASVNPIKALASRTDLRTEYTEVKSGVAQRELKRINIEKCMYTLFTFNFNFV